MNKIQRLQCLLALVCVVTFLTTGLLAQETTGGLQGTVKDQSGAVVAHAQVVAIGTSLVGTKGTETDGSGYYRFANMPPGTYTITVSAKGFTGAKRENLILEVGHLPSVDFTLQVGAGETIVEVTGEAAQVDVTTTHTLTNITPDVVADVPHGTSFQSVIQFAPAARNEPLAGNNAPAGTGAGAMARPGTGGGSPGSTSNGGGFGYQVAGGADSENRYLVEGQDTANVIGGYSHSDVPFDFIDEVQVKSSGIEAEHGGAMGGVVNVIMKHGGNAWHGSLGVDYNADAFNANQNTPFLRYDPQGTGGFVQDESGNSLPAVDPEAQTYRQAKNHFRYVQPVFTVGGPIKKDRIWMFIGLDPRYLSTSYRVNYGSNQNGAGLQTFNQDQQTYFTTARIDATVTQKLRVYASWLYQLQRESGAVLPVGDSTSGLFNVASTTPLFVYSHSYGFVAPNQTLNLGADLALSSRLVATTRFGYFFENYHDFGFPSGGSIFFWNSPGLESDGTTPVVDNNGDPLPASLQEFSGFVTAGNDQNFTLKNANKHHQFSQDIAWFQSSRFGTHNLKFGYQLNHVSNDLFQRWNAPAIFLSIGKGQFFTPAGDTGAQNCAALQAVNGYAGCAGQYGFLNVEDYGSYGYASSFNHSIYVQDAWTIGRGITINAGIRIEKEYLPGETTAGGFPAKPIQFGWGDKIAPRLGAAWDVFRDGRMKMFGSYGVFNDLMKLNLAISSFGGQYWQNCFYAIDPNAQGTFDPSQIQVVFGDKSRYCTGDSTGGANFAGGVVPSGLTFLENQNFRGTEGVAPGLKPYRQHESVFGVDYAIKKNLSLEARWDRRRLDHAIEDAATFDNTGSETFLIVNPGFGANHLNLADSCTANGGCPPNIKAARSYDGLELRLTKASNGKWFGMFSYTYSSLRGNYAGLTSTDLADGGGGRNAPNNSRAFDESFFQYNANGGSSSGPLATDRPHAFKGYAYYRIPWKGGWTSTDIGWFQTLYSGTPKSTYTDVGFSFSQPPFSGGFPVYPENRGRWANVTIAPDANGFNVPTVTSICSCRTPWFIQSDASFRQEFKLSKTHEAQVLTFEANISNLFNQQRVTAYYSQLDSAFFQMYLNPGNAFSYFAFEHPYDWKALLDTVNPDTNTPMVGNALYGKPLYYQQGRNIRLAVRWTF